MAQALCGSSTARMAGEVQSNVAKLRGKGPCSESRPFSHRNEVGNEFGQFVNAERFEDFGSAHPKGRSCRLALAETDPQTVIADRRVPATRFGYGIDYELGRACSLAAGLQQPSSAIAPTGSGLADAEHQTPASSRRRPRQI